MTRAFAFKVATDVALGACAGGNGFVDVGGETTDQPPDDDVGETGEAKPPTEDGADVEGSSVEAAGVAS